MSASEPLGTPAGVLASALVEALAAAVIYTVASLAAVLDVSERVVRGAIARGELQAAKRGGRYLISAGAVRDWAAVEPGADSERPSRARPRRADGPLRTALEGLDQRAAAGG
jgi:excisionase family DNA binding protein